MAVKKSTKRQLTVKKTLIRDLPVKKKAPDVKGGRTPPYVPAGSNY